MAMESSQNIGGSEECHSCESGWTMYIGSPYGDDAADDGSTADRDDDDEGGGDDSDYNHEDDSDDSMASDASSGPSHQGHPYGNGQGGRSMPRFKHEKDKGHGKYFLNKKASKPREMERPEKRRNEEKEEIMFLAKRANPSAQSGSAVRKSLRIGKRK